jgi:hypothetical protein
MSQSESKTKTIDGHTFEVFKLDPFDAQDILVDIGQAIGPALGSAVGAAEGIKAGGGESLLDIDIDNPEIGKAISTLLGGLDKAKLRELMTKMAEVTVYIGKEGSGKLPTVFKPLFRGNLPLMYKWFWFALEANFENFTAWLRTAISGVAGIVRAGQSPNTSKGIGQR